MSSRKRKAESEPVVPPKEKRTRKRKIAYPRPATDDPVVVGGELKKMAEKFHANKQLLGTVVNYGKKYEGNKESISSLSVPYLPKRPKKKPKAPKAREHKRRKSEAVGAKDVVMGKARPSKPLPPLPPLPRSSNVSGPSSVAGTPSPSPSPSRSRSRSVGPRRKSKVQRDHSKAFDTERRRKSLKKQKAISMVRQL